jgi:hypothetical protein
MNNSNKHWVWGLTIVPYVNDLLDFHSDFIKYLLIWVICDREHFRKEALEEVTH